MSASDVFDSESFAVYLKENRSAPRYDSSKEVRIPHPYWLVRVHDIDDGQKKMQAVLCSSFDEIPEEDEELKHIRDEVEALRQIKRRDPIRIALVGPQGAGKSLLINATFERDGLSLTGADGQACISTILRYKLDGRDSSSAMKKYTAEVAFLKAGELDNMLAGYARAFFHVHHPDEELDEDETSNSGLQAQDHFDRRAADTAEELFYTIFEGKENFQQVWNVDNYRTGEFLTFCQLRCAAALKSLQVDMVETRRVAIFAGNSPQELLQEVKPFMTKVEGQLSLWPLVSCVTIQFSDPLLEQNIEIWDLPGWGDTNTARARFADEVKDMVDVEIIVADTIRISSDDMVISSVRAAITNHGIDNVKLVATKIDWNEAEENGDTLQSDVFSKYKTYLERKRKQRKIAERASHVSKELALKLNGRNPGEVLQTFHVSAADYMTWLKSDKLMFMDQPALSPVETGIPSLRQYLFSLPADRNLQDYTAHLFHEVPNIVSKIKRVVNSSERNTGYRDIANDFGRLRAVLVPQLLDYIKEEFQKQTAKSMVKMHAESRHYINKVDKVIGSWLILKGPTLNRILKSSGTIPPGVSKAKGLEKGCNWNEDLAPLQSSGDLLIKAIEFVHQKLREKMEKPTCGVSTTEEAKRQYKPYELSIRVKALSCVKEIKTKLEYIRRRATMEDGRQTNFMSSVTEPLFDQVFKAFPQITGWTTRNRPKYAEPRIGFQRKKIHALFLDPKKHFVDRVLKGFEHYVNTLISDILSRYIERIDKDLEEYSKMLSELAPVEYEITPIGSEIRHRLGELLPQLEDMVGKLQQMLPESVRNEYTANSNATAVREPDIKSVFDESGKRKATIASMPNIKQDLDTKKPRTKLFHRRNFVRS
ncbi:uncharacterized protein EI97DRAFT_488099 [Westerdykella ornata]|uniref:Uncharacterized protein n=1 Tax=Westerdykella ornata TaxID=318751 RepID=A0A6A6JPX0_WESOR|nr:uncharacterized protein EI97DRAFT_488099 [Westerdykella ornata]KAF2277958.1 hypothetical protein EI97DRAFT_488099 [Westerdykella ornata]